MTRGFVSMDSAAVCRVVRAITNKPGISTHAIAEACGWSVSHTSKSIQVAAKAGVIGCLRVARGVGAWYLAWQLEDARDAEKERKRDLERSRCREYRSKLQKAAGQHLGRDLGLDLADHPQVNHASAWGPLPFKLEREAVRSVFDQVAP